MAARSSCHFCNFAFWHSPCHEEGFQGARIEQDQLRPGRTVNWEGKTCCMCYRILILTSRIIRSWSHRKNDWCASPSSEWRSPPPCSASPQSLNIDDLFAAIFVLWIQCWPWKEQLWPPRHSDLQGWSRLVSMQSTDGALCKILDTKYLKYQINHDLYTIKPRMLAFYGFWNCLLACPLFHHRALSCPHVDHTQLTIKESNQSHSCVAHMWPSKTNAGWRGR